MPEYFRDLPFGATVLDSGRTRFRLWAPTQRHVSVVIEGDGPASEGRPMQPEAEGWFAAEIACQAGARYRYRLDSGQLVSDPASRAQADDVHGPSVVVDPRSYRWRTEWRGRPWQEAVLYELHVGTFGGFAGVASELPRLQELGVTAVELMPIADFSGRRNWGYDGVLPFAPDRAYGTPDDLKRLVDAAHELGLMLFLDVVYNHFGPEGNYLGGYASPMFREDIHTPWGAAIDFRHPEVRRFFAENALYWLMEYRFDGLRFDAVHAITEPDWLDQLAAEVRATVEPGRQVHLVLEHDGNVADHLRHGFDAQWNDDLHHVLHVMLTGESEGYYVDYADDASERLARGLREGFVYQGEPSRHRNGEARGTPSSDLAPSSFVFFLQNHDQIGNRAFGDRLTTLADPEALQAAIALQLLCPQIPLMFMGEEVASRSPFLYFTDFHGDLAKAVRDGRRGEFASFAAFADPQRQAAIPDPNEPKTFERSRPVADPTLGAERRAFYGRALAVRRRMIVPRLAGARALDAEPVADQAVVARWRMGDGAVLTIAANLGEKSCDLLRPSGDVIFATSDAASALIARGRLAGRSTVAVLELPRE